MSPKGQSANPRDKPHLRRFQTMLNSKYRREDDAVAVLDWARAQKNNETGDLFTDREIAREALIALWEKQDSGFQALLPVRTEEGVNYDFIVQAVTDAVMIGIDARLSGLSIAPEQRVSMRRDVELSVNNAISTSNLTGDSFKFEDDDED